jgi:hypothetical protein
MLVFDKPLPALLHKTHSFCDLIKEFAQEKKTDIQHAELLLTAPDSSLATFELDTSSDLVKKIDEKAEMTYSEKQLESMKLGALIEVLLPVGIITQSCGQTSNLVQSVLNPLSCESNNRDKLDIDSVVKHINQANTKSIETDSHWYCRIESGGHCFIVECFSDKVRIYQSFFGSYSMATDIEREKIYNLSNFIERLRIAFTICGETKPPRQVREERIALFSCNPIAIHPDGEFVVSVFCQEGNPIQRLRDRYETNFRKWEDEMDKPVGEFLKTKVEIRKPEVGETLEIRPQDNKFSFYVVDGFDYKFVSNKDLKVSTYSLRHDDGYNIEVAITKVDSDTGACTVIVLPED